MFISYEMIHSLAPEDQRRQLANMRKTSEREKRHRLEGKSSERRETKQKKRPETYVGFSVTEQ